jgi:hypothetical protein
MSLSALFEAPVSLIENILEKGYDWHPMTLLLGFIVLDTVLQIAANWNLSSGNCKNTAHLCNKTLVTFQQFSFLSIQVFAYLLIISVIAHGVKRYGFKPRAFLPFASFYLFIKLFIWLFKDVFTVMETTSIASGNLFGTILKKEFYRVTYAFNADAFATTLPIVVALGIVWGKLH